MPVISIVIRTIGTRRKYLVEALDSVKRQSYTSSEVIVSEGGGTAMEGLVKNWCKKNGLNLKYISSQSKQRSHLANAGMTAASGRFICFLDDDDTIRPNHFFTLYKLKVDHPNSAAVYSLSQQRVCFFGRFLQYKRITGRHPYSRKQLEERNFLAIQSVLFETQILKSVGGFDPNLDALEDWDFWLRLSDVGPFVSSVVCTSDYYTPGWWMHAKKTKRNHNEALEYIRFKYPSKRLGTQLANGQPNLQRTLTSNEGLQKPVIILKKWLRLFLGL